MISEMKVGEARAANSVVVTERAGPFSEQIVNDVGLGRFFEAARNGRLFHTFVKAVTIAATHNSPVAANTATPVCGFLNPSNSGIAAVILRAAFGTISGTPAGGQAVINVQPNAASVLTASATGNIYGAIVSSAASPQGSQMRPQNNVALAGWLATVGPTVELCYVGQAAAAAAAGNGGPSAPVAEDLGGCIIIPPGALCALMAGTGAGTSWIVNAGLTWAEIPWPL
jgi:hypothetical protein